MEAGAGWGNLARLRSAKETALSFSSASLLGLQCHEDQKGMSTQPALQDSLQPFCLMSQCMCQGEVRSGTRCTTLLIMIA